jgi:hypothetical protein
MEGNLNWICGEQAKPLPENLSKKNALLKDGAPERGDPID